MSWIIALIGYFVIAAACTLLQRYYSSRTKLPYTVPPFLAYLIGVMPLAVVYSLILGHYWIRWSGKTILVLVMEGVFIGLYNWLSFRALSKLSASRGQLIFQIYSMVSLFGGWVVLHERLTALQLFGSVLVVAAVLASALSLKGGRGTSDKKYGYVMLLAGVCLGIGLVSEKATLGYMSVSAYLIVGFGVQTLSLGILATRDLRDALKISERRDILMVALIGTLSATSGFCYIYALTTVDNISLIGMLSSFRLPITVLAGVLILKERKSLGWVVFGCVLGTVGLVVSALGR